jgi:CRISPR-associated protein Csm4
MDDSHIPADLKKERGKEIKKLKWLDSASFKNWISSVHLGEDDLNALVSLQQAYRDTFKIEIRPRVSLDRATQNSNIYHCGYVYFKDRAGLYGFVSFNDLSTVEQFRKLLTALGETGLGGEKTYGCGLFELVSMEKVSGIFKEIFFHDVKTYTLLSLYHPPEQEMADIGNALIAYDVVRGRGWITSGRYALPLKRKSVGFFTEGSVLTSKPGGCLVDVTPEGAQPDALYHRVYRYGYAFTAPIGRQ